MKTGRDNLGMREFHPYGEFIPPDVESMIIGSFPIAKFSRPSGKPELSPGEIDFFYGGKQNLLWKFLAECWNTDLSTSQKIEAALTRNKIGLADVIKSCRRIQASASDSRLRAIEFNTRLADLINQHSIERLYFTSKQVHRWYSVNIKKENIRAEEIVLPSPSGQGSRAIGGMKEFKKWRAGHPEMSNPTYYFRLSIYKKYFGDI